MHGSSRTCAVPALNLSVIGVRKKTKLLLL
jgi:hypothetical protein